MTNFRFALVLENPSGNRYDTRRESRDKHQSGQEQVAQPDLQEQDYPLSQTTGSTSQCKK